MGMHSETLCPKCRRNTAMKGNMLCMGCENSPGSSSVRHLVREDCVRGAG